VLARGDCSKQRRLLLPARHCKVRVGVWCALFCCSPDVRVTGLENPGQNTRVQWQPNTRRQTSWVSRMLGSWKQWEGQLVNGEFHLRQHLGGADESAVFLTEYGQPQPQKAAIKLISAHATSPELQLSRWRRAAKFSHPHLIQLSQMGRCELDNTRLVFVVMEYAEEDLSQVFLERPLTPAEAHTMLKPTLGALAFLHEKGFVHGRLKLANIMSVSDLLRISSDGLHRIGESSIGLATSSTYDPPEAARGQSSAAGDVWSLGMVLVEALTQHALVWEKTNTKSQTCRRGCRRPSLT